MQRIWIDISFALKRTLFSKGWCYDVINPTVQAISIPLEFVGMKHTFMFHVHINSKHIVQYINMHVYLYFNTANWKQYQKENKEDHMSTFTVNKLIFCYKIETLYDRAICDLLRYLESKRMLWVLRMFSKHRIHFEKWTKTIKEMTEDHLHYLLFISLKNQSVLSGMSSEVMYSFNNETKQRNKWVSLLKTYLIALTRGDNFN